MLDSGLAQEYVCAAIEERSNVIDIKASLFRNKMRLWKHKWKYFIHINLKKMIIHMEENEYFFAYST